MMTPEQAAKQWVEKFNAHDLKGLMALYTDNAVNAQPHLPAPIKGKHAIEEDLGGFLKAFPDAKLQATHVGVAGNVAAMEWVFTGTQTGALVGPMGTIPASNKKVNIKGAEFTTHDAQGLIVDERGYFDLVAFMTQLGAMPAPTA
jgi:steroid delta-isomerase-like uncharacterized protein